MAIDFCKDRTFEKSPHPKHGACCRGPVLSADAERLILWTAEICKSPEVSSTVPPQKIDVLRVGEGNTTKALKDYIYSAYPGMARRAFMIVVSQTSPKIRRSLDSYVF